MLQAKMNLLVDLLGCVLYNANVVMRKVFADCLNNKHPALYPHGPVCADFSMF